MEGIYPVIIDGVECGSLEVRKEGAFTVFKAGCAMHPEVIRLSVYGGGKEGYLGVPVPRDGMLVLEKKFSPSAVREFPEHIELASLAGGVKVKHEEKKAEPPAAEDECMEEDGRKEDKEEEPCESVEEKPCQTKPDSCGVKEENCKEEAEPCDEEGPFWYASPDGALVSFDGERELVALSPDDGRVPKNIPGQPRVIEGKEYLVYITKEVGN